MFLFFCFFFFLRNVIQVHLVLSVVLGQDFEQIQGVWTFSSPPLNNLINLSCCLYEREFLFIKYKFMLVHRSNFLIRKHAFITLKFQLIFVKS